MEADSISGLYAVGRTAASLAAGHYASGISLGDGSFFGGVPAVTPRLGPERLLSAALGRHASHHSSVTGIGSAIAARQEGASKGSAKYWVSCVTRSSVNSMRLTE